MTPPSARSLATTIGALWSSFARDGVPTAPELTWPPFDPVHRATLVLDAEVDVESDPSAERRHLWSTGQA